MQAHGDGAGPRSNQEVSQQIRSSEFCEGPETQKRPKVNPESQSLGEDLPGKVMVVATG